MEEFAGATGTSASLALRLGQALFSSASLFFMGWNNEFFRYIAFWANFDRKWSGTENSTKKDASKKSTLKSQKCLHSTESRNFLMAVMSLVIPWSLGLALVDAFSILLKCPIRRREVVSFIVIGDWVLSFMSLGAACSAASVTDYMMNHPRYVCDLTLCYRSQLSAAIAFLSWFLSFASSTFNLLLLHSL